MADWIVRDAKQLCSEEESRLAKQFQGGDSEAGLALLRSQGAWIIKRIGCFPRPSSVDLDDVVSELVVVLLRALRRFDPARSALSTFVTHVIDRRTPRIIHRLSGRASGGDSVALDTQESRSTINECSDDNREMHAIVVDICRRCLSPGTRKVLFDHMSGKTLGEVADRLNARALESCKNIRRIHSPPSVLQMIKDAIGVVKDELRLRGLLNDHKDFQLSLFDAPIEDDDECDRTDQSENAGDGVESGSDNSAA